MNTIRLAIYANREEIGVMRVVGASNSLVRGPYVVDGMLCGIIATLVAFAITAPVLYFANSYLNVFIPNLDIFQYFYTHLLLAPILLSPLRRRDRWFFELRRRKALSEELIGAGDGLLRT